MPASRTVDAFKGLLVEVEPISEVTSVYFTDESPQFKLTVKTPTGSHFIEDSSITWVIAIGSGRPSPIYSDTIEIDALVQLWHVFSISRKEIG